MEPARKRRRRRERSTAFDGGQRRSYQQGLHDGHLRHLPVVQVRESRDRRFGVRCMSSDLRSSRHDLLQDCWICVRLSFPFLNARYAYFSDTGSVPFQERAPLRPFSSATLASGCVPPSVLPGTFSRVRLFAQSSLFLPPDSLTLFPSPEALLHSRRFRLFRLRSPLSLCS